MVTRTRASFYISLRGMSFAAVLAASILLLLNVNRVHAQSTQGAIVGWTTPRYVLTKALA